MIINCSKFNYKLHNIEDMTKMVMKTGKPSKSLLLFPHHTPTHYTGQDFRF